MTIAKKFLDHVSFDFPRKSSTEREIVTELDGKFVARELHVTSFQYENMIMIIYLKGHVFDTNSSNKSVESRVFVSTTSRLTRNDIDVKNLHAHINSDKGSNSFDTQRGRPTGDDMRDVTSDGSNQ